MTRSSYTHGCHVFLLFSYSMDWSRSLLKLWSYNYSIDVQFSSMVFFVQFTVNHSLDLRISHMTKDRKMRKRMDSLPQQFHL
ncbi:hypothetical protein J5N97_018593 [Dioscorea zingiberensis]|uniref:Uncharacterized protein n=1 Tax=Dioscorea zingiberensis TaxID=325984 RepID=A0A9D5HBV7_9LILI|nr:hypothetical protein J5N97_018534 [Dioscorea zingiberensis]KAJ0970634.1 hypothetical protein J5N97_018593 [Dioscorea zingiberensis]